MGDKTKINGIKLVTEKSAAQLDKRKQISYREHRRKLITWLLNKGKHPERHEGYATSTVKQQAYILDKFYRLVWHTEQRYTENITTLHADAWMHNLAESDYSQSYKLNCQRAIEALFRYWRTEKDSTVEWEPPVKLEPEQRMNPRDYLSRSERHAICEASLSYRSIPHYSNVTPEERSHWKAYLAQRYGKPKTEIGLSDWERANSWKIPSLIWTATDAGLRPIEVERMKVDWIDTANGVLRIPKEESAKNTDNWEVSLRDRTSVFLEEWLKERSLYEKYEGSDKVWLTRFGNPYASRSLNRIFKQLCDEAGIDRSKRDLSWYAIRHSVGTYMTREEDLAAAKAQLRHESIETTLIYDQTPVEDRRNALERM